MKKIFDLFSKCHYFSGHPYWFICMFRVAQFWSGFGLAWRLKTHQGGRTKPEFNGSCSSSDIHGELSHEDTTTRQVFNFPFILLHIIGSNLLIFQLTANFKFSIKLKKKLSTKLKKKNWWHLSGMVLSNLFHHPQY